MHQNNTTTRLSRCYVDSLGELDVVTVVSEWLTQIHVESRTNFLSVYLTFWSSYSDTMITSQHVLFLGFSIWEILWISISFIRFFALNIYSLTLCQSLSLTLDHLGHCCNLMKQSTAARFASGVQSALLCVLPSQWVIWKEKCPCSMAWMLSEFLPPRGVRLPHSSFLVLSFLSPSLSLS